MSIKPILFNTEMVRAILDGRKSLSGRKENRLAVGTRPSICRKKLRVSGLKLQACE